MSAGGAQTQQQILRQSASGTGRVVALCGAAETEKAHGETPAGMPLVKSVCTWPPQHFYVNSAEEAMSAGRVA